MTFAERFIEARQWPAARKTAFVSALLLPGPLFGWLWARALHAIGGPLAETVESLTLAWFVAALLVFAVSVVAMRRGWRARWAPYLFAVVYSVHMATTVLLVGVGMPTFLTWIPLVALLAAFCFDERVGGVVLLLSIAILVLGDFAGLTPELPVQSTELDDALQAMARQVAVALVLANFVFCILVLSSHRLMEGRVQEANRLIRRYVPAQLADRIAAGGHAEGATHERRKLTIFFSDVVGFTSLSDELDAEELATVLNEYLSEMTQIADRFGATVNQLVGDGIMIFFGAPTATDDRDHALRAVRMGQAMQQRMAELRERWFQRGLQRPFHIRIGVNTGFASVGDFGSAGRMMYSAIGQQTNLAARIQSHCEPDRILLSHSTWALVKDEIPCVPKGEIQVKGLHYAVLVYEVTDAVARSAA